MADFTMCPSTWPIASTSVTCDSFDYDVINTHTQQQQQQQAGTKNKLLFVLGLHALILALECLIVEFIVLPLLAANSII